MELHHDLSMESRIVRFLATKFKFLNSKYIKKVVAITKGVKNEYIKKKIIKASSLERLTIIIILNLVGRWMRSDFGIMLVPLNKFRPI